MAELSGVWAKIDRAKAHQADLKARIEQVVGPRHQRFWLEPDPASGTHALRVKGIPDVVPQWMAIVGDCLHNLRSALDHLAWQLVLLDGKTPGRNTQFPVKTSPPKGGIQLVPAVGRQDILDALEAVQPYMTRTIPPEPTANPRDNLLWILNELNNIDKHRLLLVILCVPSRDMSWGWNTEDGPGPEVKIRWAALTDGSPMAWFDFQGWEPPANFYPDPEVQVVLSESEVAVQLNDRSLPNVLDTFIWWVEMSVVRMKFEHLF